LLPKPQNPKIVPKGLFEINKLMKPLISISYFSLSCMYLLATFTCTVRFLTHNSLPGILKLFYSSLILLCLVRFIAFAIAASLMSSDSYYYRFLLSSKSLSNDELYEVIQHMKDSNSTLGSDLPIELQWNMGINRAPVAIVCCILAPEIITLCAYLFLTWHMLAVYIESYPKDLSRNLTTRNGD